AQQRAYLPRLAAGTCIGTFALAEGTGNPYPQAIRAQAQGGKLSGTKLPVADGSSADLAVVAALDKAGTPALYLVDLQAPGIKRTALKTIDPSRNQAQIEFEGAEAEPLGPASRGWEAITRLLERAAIPVAFEQLGGAQACLDMARAYALQRYAFGRPIGSFQAIKHRLADVYIATELARSNVYYGAWALAAEADELPVAAAAARISATQAFQYAAQENIQTHGGMGFTWEYDCHLYYRRAKLLGLCLGSLPYWKDRLILHLERRQAR
ncbi:MAG TPA: acyl-CoA dehydrogenase, partial [bacterium]|nr:acyl-CoA dehydrogenase [bacterium]